MTVDGEVIAAYSHWTRDHARIITEATIRTDDGEEIVVHQLGGTADGFGMISFPAPPLLVPGMRVAVAAHRDADLARQEHVMLDDVRVVSYPPDYVRSETKRHRPLYWESGCALVTVDAAGTTAIDGDTEFRVIDDALETWNHDTVTPSCAYLRVINEGRKAMEVGDDQINLIKFRDTMWGRPAVDGDAAELYSPGAAGLTTVKYVLGGERDGAIVDADIELNGVYFAIAVNRATNATGCIAELQNTLAHELGHLRGLEHTCLADGDPPRVDHQGNPVPSCSGNTDPSIVEATMYNFQSCGEIKKETLSPDDIQAMCDIYPVARDPGTCEPALPVEPAGCCGVSGGARPDAALLLAGASLLVLRRRRTRV